MRLATVPIRSEPEDPDGNLARHLEALDAAWRERCELVLFPERSLTGHETVAPLVREAHRRNLAVSVGLAAGAGEGGVPTQVFVQGGLVRGALRRGDATGRLVGELGAVRVGLVLGADVGDTADWGGAPTGVDLLAVAAGPAGGPSLDAVRREAARLGIWVALVDGGSSREPAAAVVAPDGAVAAELAVGDDGPLIVDLPLAVEVEPVRRAARVLLVDTAGRALLVQFAHGATGDRFWATPGGGLDPGEDELAAAHRELREELDRDDLPIGPSIGRRRATFRWGDGWLTQDERWFLCRCDPFDVVPERVASLREEGILDMRWWTVDELRGAGVDTIPRELPELLDELLRGAPPDPDRELSA